MTPSTQSEKAVCMCSSNGRYFGFAAQNYRLLEHILLSESGVLSQQTRRLPDVSLMLERRRRRRANIKPASGKSLVSAGK